MADKNRQSENEEQPEEQEGSSGPISRETAGTLGKGAAAGAAAGAAVGAAAAAVRQSRSGGEEPEAGEAEGEDAEE